ADFAANFVRQKAASERIGGSKIHMPSKSPLVLIATFLTLVAFSWPPDRASLLPAPTPAATLSATEAESSPVPDSELQYRVALVADNDVLNVRAAPGVQSAVVDSLPNGEIVQPLGSGRTVNGDFWIPIRYGAGKTGWVNRSYLIATRDRAAFC